MVHKIGIFVAFPSAPVPKGTVAAQVEAGSFGNHVFGDFVVYYFDLVQPGRIHQLAAAQVTWVGVGSGITNPPLVGEHGRKGVAEN